MRRIPDHVKQLAEILYMETGLTLGKIGELLGFEKNEREMAWHLVRALPAPKHRGRGLVGRTPLDVLKKENDELRAKVQRLEERLLEHGDTEGIQVGAILDRVRVGIYDRAATGDLKELASVLRPLLMLEERDKRLGEVGRDKIVAEVLKEVRSIADKISRPKLDAPHAAGEVPEDEEMQ